MKNSSNNSQKAVGMMSRRVALKTLAVGGAIAAAGGLPLFLGASGSVGSAYAGEPEKMKTGALKKVRLAWAEPASCHAPMSFAIEKGMFAKQGIDLELVYLGIVGADQIKAMDAGKVDMASHLLVDWLDPIYKQKADVKIVAGTHDGCQRILVSKSSKITTVADLKGKTIAVGGIGDVAYLAFLVTVAKAGLDPHNDVKWVAVPYDKLGEAVDSGKADALATLDALAYLNKKQFDMREVANTQTGHYDNRTCCVLGVNGEFLSNNRDVVRKVTTTINEAYDYTSAMPREVAEFYVNKYKPGYSAENLTSVLAALPLRRHPLGKDLQREIADSIDDMKEVKVMSASVDKAKFAAQITDNIMV